MEERNHASDNRLFYSFLLLLAVVPLPFGSNRPWAWGLLELWTYGLAIFWLIGYSRGLYRFSAVFMQARPALYLFAAWLFYTGLKIVPLPAPLVALLSPEIARIYQDAGVVAGEMAWLPLSLDAHASAVEWLKSLAYVLIFCLTLLLANTRRRIRLMLVVLVYCGLFQALYGIVETASQQGHHATGTFVNRNHLAGYLEMTLAIGLGLLISQLGGEAGDSWRQRIHGLLVLIMSPKMRLRVYLAVMVIALVLTHSRMGNVAFFVAMLVAGAMALLLSRHTVRSIVILLVSLMVIDVLILGTLFGLEKVAERIQATSIESDTRTKVDVYTLDLIGDYPIFGSGGGTFEYIFPRYKGDDVITAYFDHAHNDYLEFTSDNGLLGLSILGTVVIWSFAMAVSAQYRRRDPLMRGVSFAAIMGIVSLMIHSAVDFNLQIPANAVMFMILLSSAWLASCFDARKTQ